jgi:polyisoprenoid-binding protein YceI
MNRLVFVFLFFIFSFASAQKYKPVDAGSKVHFVIKNFGIKTGGDLSGLSGDINFVPANVAACRFNVSVDVKTIDTDNDSRDGHLKGKEYFDSDKFPMMTIKSAKINKTNKPNWFYFTGTLTMHGVTKNIAFPFTATPKGNDILFAGDFNINRLDYGVGSSSAVLSNDVKVSLSVLAKKN